jgi:moderate conductance mechanosensitive channel
MLLRALFIIAFLLPASGWAADGTPPDTAARVTQLQGLLATQQGAAVVDLLSDPKVRNALLAKTNADAPSTTPPRQRAMAGEMMNTTLMDVRSRLWGVAAGLGGISDELPRVWTRVQELLPGIELPRLLGLLVVFLAGGLGTRVLFFYLARPWRAHFGTMRLSTPRERAVAVGERLLFGTLVIASFAAGSMGVFLLFQWPPLTGPVILGYLLAFVIIRLSLTTTRFFFAPGAEHLRLLPVSTKTAWFWHRWVTFIVAVAAIGWQTILTLRTFGMSRPSADSLFQLLLLVLACLGIYVIWTMPLETAGRGRLTRLLATAVLVVCWLLFLTGASAYGWSVLILAAAPIAISVLNRSVSIVIAGSWPVPDDSSPYVRIVERAMQAIVLLCAVAAMVHVWQLDMASMSAMDTPITRVVRGLLEALLIMVIADLLWQVVRVLIDTRLAGDASLADALDDDALSRRARLHTLLPVLRNFAFVIVLAMALLSALAAMGLQIGPLLAGAGVVGVAVGFGAQTLVRDVISGVFFLLDDAFRVGEEIESGGIRGTVDSFSLRSIKLRHLTGQLHTVPFGDLKAITNYSRDWVVEHLSIVLTYDADLDLVDNIIDTVSDELMADPILSPELIEPLRSLGVQAMIDTGMSIGMVFKTRPGRQFAVRRAVFGRIRAAFAAHGIRFATVVAQSAGDAGASTAIGTQGVREAT